MPKMISDLFSACGGILAFVLGFIKGITLFEGVLISAIPLIIGYVGSRLPVFLNLFVVKDKEYTVRVLAGVLFGQILIAFLLFGMGAGVGYFFK